MSYMAQKDLTGNRVRLEEKPFQMEKGALCANRAGQGINDQDSSE